MGFSFYIKCRSGIVVINGISINIPIKSKSQLLLIGGILLAMFAGTSYFYLTSLAPQAQVVASKIPTVAIEDCQTREIKNVFRGFGTVQAWKEVILKPNAQSIVREVLAKVGDRVAEKQILLKSNSEIQEIKEELERVDFELRNIDFSVTMALAKKKFLSAKEVQQKSLEHKSNILRSRLMQIENAGVLRTPIAGIISELDFKVGEYVDNSSLANIRVVDVSQLKIPLYLPQKIIKFLSRNLEVTLHRDAKEEPVIGKISSISPSVDSKTGSVFTEVAIENPPPSLLPGMYVEIEIPLQHIAEAKSVPLAAIVREGDKVFIFKIDQSLNRSPASDDDSRELGKAIKVEVKTGLQEGEYIEIREGLEEFDQVVVRGASALSDGTAVEIIR